MAGKISEMTPATTLVAGDEIEVRRGLDNLRADISLLAAITGGHSHILVAAADSSANARARADYICDGTDDQIQIQAAIDSLNTDITSNPGGVVLLAAGEYSITQIKMVSGVSLCGEGADTYGTALYQPGGTNLSAIVNDETYLPTSTYWTYSVMDGFFLSCLSGNTSGCGIEATCFVGEGWRPRNIRIRGFPESGIGLRRGGTPVFLDDLGVFANGQFGISLGKTAGGGYGQVALTRISGDDNGTALIRVQNVSPDSAGGVYINSVKAEALTAGKQQVVILLDSIFDLPVKIDNLHVSSPVEVGGLACIQISGEAAKIQASYVHSTNYTYFIDDLVAPRTVVPFTSAAPPALYVYTTAAGGTLIA